MDARRTRRAGAAALFAAALATGCGGGGTRDGRSGGTARAPEAAPPAGPVAPVGDGLLDVPVAPLEEGDPSAKVRAALLALPGATGVEVIPGEPRVARIHAPAGTRFPIGELRAALVETGAALDDEALLLGPVFALDFRGPDGTS
ncbi:MAG: hypothetical protein L0216_01830 [Planctomycetales bacterium]|nr:hypothetical protein [Planctomycetales bacterium]